MEPPFFCWPCVWHSQSGHRWTLDSTHAPPPSDRTKSCVVRRSRYAGKERNYWVHSMSVINHSIRGELMVVTYYKTPGLGRRRTTSLSLFPWKSWLSFDNLHAIECGRRWRRRSRRTGIECLWLCALKCVRISTNKWVRSLLWMVVDCWYHPCAVVQLALSVYL